MKDLNLIFKHLWKALHYGTSYHLGDFVCIQTVDIHYNMEKLRVADIFMKMSQIETFTPFIFLLNLHS